MKGESLPQIHEAAYGHLPPIPRPKSLAQIVPLNLPLQIAKPIKICSGLLSPNLLCSPTGTEPAYSETSEKPIHKPKGILISPIKRQKKKDGKAQQSERRKKMLKVVR